MFNTSSGPGSCHVSKTLKLIQKVFIMQVSFGKSTRYFVVLTFKRIVHVRVVNIFGASVSTFSLSWHIFIILQLTSANYCTLR